MKTMLRCLLASAALALASVAHAGTFAAEKPISDVGVAAQFPSVAYFNNVIHVAWVGYPTAHGDIFYAYSTNAGANWSAPVNVSNSAETVDRPQITAGPNGVAIAWHTDGNTGRILATRTPTTTGGGAFSAPVQIADSGPAFYSRLTGLFTDSGGDVHLVYYDDGYAGGTSVGEIRHRMMCGPSGTLGPDTAVTSIGVDGEVDNEAPRIAEAGGKMHVIYRSSRNGDPQGGWSPYSIQLQSGTKSGCAVAWAYPARRIAGGVPFSYASMYTPDLASDPSGNLHLGWWDDTFGTNVMYRRGNPATGNGFGAIAKVSSFDVDHPETGGLSSTPSQTLGGFDAPPGIASNGSSAVMTYQQNSGTTGSAFEFGQVYLRESTNNGTTWGAEVPISGTGQANTPRVALGGAGNQNVAVVWTDVRTPPARIYFRLYSLGPVSGPQLVITPSTFTFPDQVIGGAATQTTLTVQNVGTATATISSITGSGDFSIAAGGSCGATLANGASCTLVARFAATALGTRRGTVTVASNAFDSPAQSQLTGNGLQATGPNARALNVNAVITGYYESILGRSPDAGGLAFWSNEASRVVNLGADTREVFFVMALQFFNSAEYLGRNTGDTQYITDLYRTFFLREPDSAGLAFWVPQLNPGGMDRGAMLNNFLFSPEFANLMTSLFGSATVRPEFTLVLDLYRGILGGLPDNGGFAFWLAQLKQAQCAGGNAVIAKVSEMAQGFINSPEYGNREAARPPAERVKRHVGDLYNAIFRRGSDLGGYNFWAGQINGGFQTRDQVREGFLASAEFQARVNQVIAAGCQP